MGIVYEGPYRHLIDSYAHEGYAAARLPDGTLTGTWAPRIAEVFTGYVAACDCGWRGDEVHPATEDGEADAEAAWEREHLQPMIEAAERSWPDWARRVAVRADQIADHMAAGRLVLAVEVFARLADVVATWQQIAAELAEIADIQRAAADHGPGRADDTGDGPNRPHEGGGR